MIRTIFLGLCLLTTTLFARPYLSEYHASGMVVIFHGDIKEGDEGQVRVLQTQYLESLVPHPHHLHYLEAELKKLGVKITQVEHDPSVQSENATPYFPPSSPTPPTNTQPSKP